jgi:hypothetical protein
VEGCVAWGLGVEWFGGIVGRVNGMRKIYVYINN